jgi:pyruvate formate lyase activating enzyme
MTTNEPAGREAALWHPLEQGGVRCELCHHRCRIEPGDRGDCCVRENRGGTLETLTYGRLISANVDPIEKKPLFHFRPGSLSLSVASVGCNFRCTFCQNWTIAHWPRQHPGQTLPGDLSDPADVAELARRRRCATIAYTYTEPTIFWEFVKDTGEQAKARGVANILVTNGFMTPQALDWMGDVVDAANVDLKGADRKTLERFTGAQPAPVRRNIRLMHERGIWVEVTTLIVPGLNDNEAALRSIATFLAELDPNIPWHLSRFHPNHEMSDGEATPAALLRDACRWGRDEGLRYVYTGNLWGDDNESTRCPGCGEVVIERHGFRLGALHLTDGRCDHCQTAVAGVGMP